MSQSTDNPGYVDPAYLKLTAEQLEQYKQMSYAALAVTEGAHVLDVGCGPATDTISLAKLVGPNGRVVGVDYDPAMIVEANKRATEAGVGKIVEHQHMDATALLFEAFTFDATRSERMFQHLKEPMHALIEMIRVTKQGGRVCVMDTDWGAFIVDYVRPELRDVAASVFRVHAEDLLYNGHIGRQLYRLFKHAGIREVTVQSGTLTVYSYALMRTLTRMDRTEAAALESGVVTKDELARLNFALNEADARGEFFALGIGFVVAGTKG